MTTPRQPRIVIAGQVLNDDQRAGRTCAYCKVTFGNLDPVPALTGVDGVMLPAAHRACVDANRVARARRDRGRRAHRHR